LAAFGQDLEMIVLHWGVAQRSGRKEQKRRRRCLAENVGYSPRSRANFCCFSQFQRHLQQYRDNILCSPTSPPRRNPGFRFSLLLYFIFWGFSLSSTFFEAARQI